VAVEDKEIAALRRLGLTDYEARVYLVLVKMGPIRASEASFFGQLPRTKTYGAIKELGRKGLLNVIPGKPDLYSARSPGEVLMPLIDRLNNDVKDSEGIVQSLAVTFESSKFVKRQLPSAAGEFWKIEGRQNIFNKLNTTFNDASKSIIYCTTAAGLIRAYKVHSEMLEKAKGKGASVRFLSPISNENSGVAREMAAVVELRIPGKPLSATFVSTDSVELVVIETRPDDLRTDRGSDLAIWTTNKLLIELHEQLFGIAWDASIPAKLATIKNQ
jgi:sugar-specific transcriptional regulator TrmB